MNYSSILLIVASAAVGCDNMTDTRTDGVDVTPSSSNVSDRDVYDRNATDPTVVDRNVTGPNVTDGNVTDRNAADRDDSEKTPFDQYENESDIDTTAQIRSRVVDTEMSVSAQNVKIITQNGKVTLRGEVKSDTEKQQVETIALAVAGEGNVDNQLQVDQE